MTEIPRSVCQINIFSPLFDFFQLFTQNDRKIIRIPINVYVFVLKKLFDKLY